MEKSIFAHKGWFSPTGDWDNPSQGGNHGRPGTSPTNKTPHQNDDSDEDDAAAADDDAAANDEAATADDDDGDEEDEDEEEEILHVLFLVQATHLRLVLTSRFDPNCCPQSAY